MSLSSENALNDWNTASNATSDVSRCIFFVREAIYMRGIFGNFSSRFEQTWGSAKYVVWKNAASFTRTVCENLNVDVRGCTNCFDNMRYVWRSIESLLVQFVRWIVKL